MDMKPKFNLTVDENIFVAKRNIIDYIWKSARLEGLAVTFPETEAIYNGMGVANVPVNDIIAVNNLKHAWQFMFDTMDYPTDFAYICHLNRIVGDGDLIHSAGFLINIPVTIGGTSWKPDFPNEPDIKAAIKKIVKIENPTERSISLMLYCMRSQMFLDGNKRTSMLAANHEMIMNGCGIISVPIEHQLRFTELLVKFYETNEPEELARFVYNNCIDGLDLREQEKSAQQSISNKATLDERLTKVHSDIESQPTQTHSHEQVRTKKNDVLE